MAKQNLGTLGKPREDVDMDFGWFDAAGRHGAITVRVNPGFSEWMLTDFMRKATTIQEGNERAAFDATEAFLKSLVHPDDQDAFWLGARAGRQSAEDLMLVCTAIVEAVSGFPTGRSSDSSDGPPTTPPKLRAVSSTPDAAVTDAFEQLEGRPDLMMAVVRAQQAQTA